MSFQSNLAEVTQPNAYPRVLKIRSIQLVFCLTIAFVSVSLVAIMRTLDHLQTFQEDVIPLVTAIASYLYFLRALFRIKPFLDWEVQVFGDSIQVKKEGMVYTLLLDDIAAVDVSSFGFLGGNLILTRLNGDPFIVPMGLERPEYILDAVFSYNPDLMSVETYKSYRWKAVAFDHSQQRKVERLHNSRGLILRYLFVPVGVFLIHQLLKSPATLSLQTSVREIALSALVCLITGIVLVAVEEYAIRFSFEEQYRGTDHRRRDYKVENAIHRLCTGLFYSLAPIATWLALTVI